MLVAVARQFAKYWKTLLTKWADNFPWGLAEVMVNACIQDRKDFRDRADIHRGAKVVPSAVAEVIQESEEEICFDQFPSTRSDDLCSDRSQCSGYPRSLAVRFFHHLAN
jgi:hypothetical protein